MCNPVLELYNIKKTFKEDSKDTITILGESSFSINSGEMVAMVGPSGCGKSTFLQICGLLDNANSGKIIINNIDTTHLSDRQRTNIRKKNIGFVYQMHNLFPEFTAYENVALPLMVNGESHFKNKVIDLLSDLGLKNKINSLPAELSGGEKQRVAIARALIIKPKLILADEPTGNLDEENSLNVLNILTDFSKKYNSALIMVTHNKDLTTTMDRVITIKDKKIIEIK